MSVVRVGGIMTALLRRFCAVWAGMVLGGAATGLSAQMPVPAAPIRASVGGTVFDSVAMAPLPGALVRIVRADDPSIGRSAIADPAGRYTFDSVPAGSWLVTFLHPVLDSLRLEPGVLQLVIADTVPVMIPLAIPSGRSLVARACGAGLPDEYGMIFGEVRRADDEAPIAGATIEIEWPEWVLEKRLVRTQQQRVTATTDSVGRYTLCGAPAGSTLRSVTWHGADTSGVVEVIVPPTGYAMQDFAVGSVEYVAALPDAVLPDAVVADSTTTVRLRRGQATVRGRVTTVGGAPLPNAAVRVLGSGAQVQTSATGEFTITNAVAGTQSIEARAIGYQPHRRAVRLSNTGVADVSLVLATRNVELDTIRVVAGREIPWDVRGIERRWRSGLGKFLDGKTVRDRTTMYTTDALRGIGGVFVRQMSQGYGQQIMMRGFMGGECRASLFVDGMPVAGNNTGLGRAGMESITIDEMVQPDMVAAIEVYARPNQVPAEYMTMRTGCGVVAMWTKYGTGNVPVLPPKSDRR